MTPLPPKIPWARLGRLAWPRLVLRASRADRWKWDVYTLAVDAANARTAEQPQTHEASWRRTDGSGALAAINRRPTFVSAHANDAA